MGQVINMFEAKKRLSNTKKKEVEKKSDTVGYDLLLETMRKNVEQAKKRKQERLRETQRLADKL